MFVRRTAWRHHPHSGLEKIRKDLLWRKTLVSCSLSKLEAKTEHACGWVGPIQTCAHQVVSSHARWHCPRGWPPAPFIPHSNEWGDPGFTSPPWTTHRGHEAHFSQHYWLINRRMCLDQSMILESVISWEIWTASFTRLTCSWCSLKYVLHRLFNHILYPFNISIFLSLENDIHYS